MKTNEILEGNTLIAKFLGVSEKVVIKYNKDPKIWSCNVKYHLSWDWLMPVVEKIINDRSSECQFTGKGYLSKLSFSMLNDENHPFNGESETSLKEATWTAVIEFIKWYNTQSNE